MTSDNRQTGAPGLSDAVDRAIDDVAGEMTAGHADVNLRVRVLADLERPRSFVWRPLFAVVALAAAILIAIVVSRGPRVPIAPRTEQAKVEHPPVEQPRVEAPRAQGG